MLNLGWCDGEAWFEAKDFVGVWWVLGVFLIGGHCGKYRFDRGEDFGDDGVPGIGWLVMMLEWDERILY